MTSLCHVHIILAIKIATYSTYLETKYTTQMEPFSELGGDSTDSEYIVRSYLEDGKYIEAFTYCHTCEGQLEGMKESRKQLGPKEQVEFYVALLHGIYSDLRKNAVGLLANSKLATSDEMVALENKIEFYAIFVQFLKVMHSTVPNLLDMLQSSSMSDVNEAIDFFVVAYKFNLKDSLKSLECMLQLVRTNEKERKIAVGNAYKKVFFDNTDNKTGQESVISLIQGLIKVLKTSTINSVENFGIIVGEWVTTGLVTKEVLEYLWQMFTGHIENVTPFERRAVLKILSFAAKGRLTIIERNVQLITEIAFKQYGKQDPFLVIVACEALSLIGKKPVTVEDKKSTMRYPLEDPMWEYLTNVIYYYFEDIKVLTSEFSRAVVDVIYKLCRKPDVLCEKIIRHFHVIVSKEHTTVYLAHFIHFLGEIAIKQFAYLDISVYKEMKRRNYSRANKNKEKKAGNLNMTSASASHRANVTEEESYLEGAQADDEDADFILQVCEKELVTKNLLGFFQPLLMEVMSKPNKYDDAMLQSATSLTMTRYMLISSVYCKKQIHFVMTVLENTKFTGVKNNILVSISDLLNRYPNTIEPWTPNIYKCMRDSCAEVRLTAVTVITSLLVQHMLRVKGNIAEVARCLNDENEDVRSIVNGCFYSLSQQNPHPIYNILPDIISNMSNDAEQINEEEFRNVMKFLMKTIDKDKQIEPLVEKLCSRICATDNERHMRDVAYCLTLIHHNDKSINKIIQMYSSFKNKLDDEEVQQMFIIIADKYKTSQKSDVKQAIRRLDELLRTGKTTEDGPEAKSDAKQKKKNTKKEKKDRSITVGDTGLMNSSTLRVLRAV